MKKLILINGAPASGKTTLVRYLRNKINISIIEKDALKEYLFDAVGCGDREWSKMIGQQSIDMVYRLASEILKRKDALLIENAFMKEYAREDIKRLQSETGCQILEVYCDVDKKIRLRRFIERAETNRHPGHGDLEGITTDGGDQITQYGPIGLGDILYVHTDNLDFETEGTSIVQKIKLFLEG